MMWFLALAAAQSVPPATEPILGEATVDVRAMRLSRPAAAAAMAAPITFGLGQFSDVSFRKRTRQTSDDAQEGAGAAGPVLVGIGAIVASGSVSVWMQNTRTSERALRAQGLRPKSVPRVQTLLTVISSATALIGWGLARDLSDERTRRAGTVFTAVGAGMYVGAFSLPVIQQRHNRKARIAAGWWTP